MQALRTLRRAPAFTATAVVALALGIGANTAIFSVIDAVLLKPLPYPEPDRIVRLLGSAPDGNDEMCNVPRFNVWRQQTGIFDAVAAYDWAGAGVNLTMGDRPEQLKGKRVTRDYFRVFGTGFALGRGWTAEEDRPGSGRYAVISHGLWRRRFGADPGIVGRTISLGGDAYVVTGVMDKGFTPDPPADVWRPLQADPATTDQAYYLLAAARLKPGVTVSQAQASLRIAADGYRKDFPKDMRPKNSFTAEPMAKALTSEVRPALLVLLSAVALVLLIACANVAGLMMARAAGREREIAIRRALGASGWQIVRHLLGESLLLSLCGGTLGLAIGAAGVRALLALAPMDLPRLGKAASLPLNARMLVFTLAISLATAVVAGLLPALHAARGGVAQPLQQGGSRSGGRRHNRMRAMVVVAEMALSMMLLIGAGLLLRSFAALRKVDPGVHQAGILTMQTSLTGMRYLDSAGVARAAGDTLAKVRMIPGVASAAAADSLPLEYGLGMGFVLEGRPFAAGRSAHGGTIYHYVTAGYFDTFGIPIVQGRGFTERDVRGAPDVALINQTMAGKYWRDSSPIGTRISISAGRDAADPVRQIVGIVADVHDAGPRKESGNIMYVPLPQVRDRLMLDSMSWYPLSWAVRAPAGAQAAIRHEFEAAGLPPFNVRPMRELVERSTGREEFNALVLGIFAGLAILLAGLGLYSVIAYGVQQRTLEFGIRLAVGAAPATLRNMIVRQTLTLVAAGVVAGTCGALAVTRLMEGLLYGVRATDPLVFGIVPVLQIAVALVASYVPAKRALRTDPITALRHY